MAESTDQAMAFPSLENYLMAKTKTSSVPDITDRFTAKTVHAAMRKLKTCPVAMGRLYQSLLARDLWLNASDLASGLSVSAAQVSRSLAAARLPEEIINAFGGESHVTYRLAAKLNRLIGVLGSEALVESVNRLPRELRGHDEDALYHWLVTGNAITPELRITFCSDRNSRYIRLDGPDIENIPSSSLRELQRLLMDWKAKAITSWTN